jgi:hypothetical protein
MKKLRQRLAYFVRILIRACCKMFASASWRDNTDRSLARTAWESVPRKNRPVGYQYDRAQLVPEVFLAEMCAVQDRLD